MDNWKLPKTTALVTILNRLDAGEKLTIDPLAKDLGVTRRSIFRYLETLQAAGYPIYYDRTDKSYRFVEKYKLRHTSSEKRLIRALEMKQQMIQTTSVGMAAYHADGTCNLANEAIARMINATREQVLAQNFRTLKSWRESGLLALVDEALLCKTELSGDFHFISTFGKEVWVSCIITPFENSNQSYFFLTAHDISSRKQQELDTASLVAAINKTPKLTIITDNKGIVIYASDKLTDVTGYSADEIIGNPLLVFQPGVMSPSERENLCRTLSEGREWTGENNCSRKNGTSYLAHIHVAPVFAADGSVDRFIAVIEDITQQKQLEEELYLHATTDALTGLYNRRMIFVLGGHEIAVSCRHRRPMALLMVDVDRFKQINDTYGHAAGDETLRKITERFRIILRTSDLIGRVGGDEFVVVLSDTSAYEARQVAERLRNDVEKLSITWKESVISCTVSIGVAAWQKQEEEFESFLERADGALYVAKESGRNSIADKVLEPKSSRPGRN